jgi:hypothetical protein
MFVAVNLQYFIQKYLNIFIYLHVRFNISASSSSIVITNKQKTREKLRKVDIMPL